MSLGIILMISISLPPIETQKQIATQIEKE